MAKLLVCIDGSTYADNLCANAAWVAKQIEVIRSSLPLKMAVENQSKVGQRFYLVSRIVGLDHPSWLWVMARWVFGKQ